MSESFNQAPWSQHAVVYEVNLRQYTREGTIAAFMQHLPRLKEMGVQILWFMPLTPISVLGRQGSLGSYYACSAYTAINPEFGTEADFKTLVTEAHRLGMYVIIDWVANHTGMDHVWTVSNKDWYLLDAQGDFTERNGWKDVIDLNYSSAAMRAAMVQAMQWWVHTFDIDGFRCDMAHLVPLDFWQEARLHCDQLKPLYWLAECEEVTYHQVFDTTYAWAWMHASERYARGEAGLQQVQDILHSYTQYPPHASKLFYTSNHDENSWNGTDTEKYGQAAKAWAVFTATWEGITLLYSGQENALDKRLAFFDKDAISWSQPPILHDFYQTLFQFKQQSKALQGGETFILPSEHSEQLFCYLRKKGEQVVLVLLNVSGRDRLSLQVYHPWLTGIFKNVFSGLSHSFQPGETFELQAGEYLVYARK